MKKPQVVVFNNHGVGQTALVDHIPRPGETVTGRNWKIDQDGGKGSNVAIALGRLGVSSAFIGKLGQDVWGDLGLEWMRDAGVDTSRVRRCPDVNTSTGVVLVQANGQNSIIVGESSSDAMTFDELEEDLDIFRNASIFISGFEIRPALALHACRRAKEKGMITVLNPSPLPARRLEGWDQVDILLVNEEEGKGLAGREGGQNPESIVQRISERYQIATVIMTIGPLGCVLRHEKKTVSFPAFDMPVVDTTGAGDGFLAALVANLVWGKPMEESCRWANLYASYCISQHGTIPSYPAYARIARIIDEMEKKHTSD